MMSALREYLHEADLWPDHVPAAEALLDRSIDTVPMLVEFMQSTEVDIERAAAAELLGGLGDPAAVDALLAGVVPPTQRGKWPEACARALGAIGDRRAVTPLVAFLRQTSNKPVNPRRRAAGIALGQLLGSAGVVRSARTIRMVPEPTDLIDHYPVKPTGKNLLNLLDTALVENGYPPSRSIEEFFEQWGIGEERHIKARYGDQALPALRDLIARTMGQRRPGELVTFVKALGYLNDPAVVGDLLTLFRDCPGEADAEIIKTLGKGAYRAVVPYDDLLTLLEHPRLDARLYAIETLGKNKEKQAIPILQAILQRDDHKKSPDDDENVSWRLWAETATALSRIGDKAALDSLLTMLDRAPELPTGDFVAAVAKLGGTAALLDLMKSHPDREVRREAINELAKRRSKANIAALLEVLRTGDNSMKISACDALEKLKIVEAAPLILDWWRTDMPHGFMRGAIRILGSLGDPDAVPVIAECLTDMDRTLDDVRDGRRTVAEFAHDALVAIGTPEALAALKVAPAIVGPSLELLSAALENPDQPHTYKKSVMTALGESGDLGAVEPLNRVLTDLDALYFFRLDAVEALGVLGTPNAIAALEHAQDSDPQNEVRKAICLLLRKLKQ